MTAFPQRIPNVAFAEYFVDLGITRTRILPFGFRVHKSPTSLDLPGRGGGNAGQLFVEGITPEIFVSRADKKLAGRNGSSQKMGVHRQRIHVFTVGLKCFVEPVTVVPRDVRHGFTDLASEQACAAAAGANRDYVSKALLKGTGHHGGLSEAGAACAAHTIFIEFPGGQQVLHHITHTATPNEQLARIGSDVPLRPEDLTDAVVKLPCVRGDVIGCQGCHGDTLLNETLRWQRRKDSLQGHADGDQQRRCIYVHWADELEGEGIDTIGIDQFQFNQLHAGMWLAVRSPAGIIADPGFFPDRQGFRRQESVGITLKVIHDLSPAATPAFFCDRLTVRMGHQLRQTEIFQDLFHREPPIAFCFSHHITSDCEIEPKG